MSLNCWSQILQQWEPKYEVLQKIGQGMVPIKIFKNYQHDYTLCIRYDLEEDFQANQNTYLLNDIINWATEELVKWPRVRRTAYDMWKFSNKKQADKFITLFNLRWAR